MLCFRNKLSLQHPFRPRRLPSRDLQRKETGVLDCASPISPIANAIHRDSVQRAQCWWLPYLVMEYEVNQVLITALGGEIQKPVYMYQANL